MAEPTAASLPRSHPAALTKSRWPRRVTVASLFLTLGLITTVGLVAASAYWAPFTRPALPFQTATISANAVAAGGITVAVRGGTPSTGAVPAVPARTLKERLADWKRELINPAVQVGQWGDHLQPWHIELDQPWAHRSVWFAKGRVYGAGASVKNSTASSAAVACWSFATACWQQVGGKLTPGLTMPPKLAETYEKAGPGGAPNWAGCIETRGWPFPCATARIHAPMTADASAPTYVVTDGIPLSAINTTNAIQDYAVLPTRPLWAGLIANTLVFAGAWWLLSLAPLALVRRVFRRKGACPQCGYDLTAIGGRAQGCPECGWNKAPAPPAPPAPPAAEPQTAPAATP